MPTLCDEATGGKLRCRLLPRSFYLQPPQRLAPALLGKILVRRWRGHLLAGRIVEVEAYLGREDPAAHAFAGQTARNAVLFGPPGHAYVYGIYGLHHCLNIACQPEGTPGCVLLRALAPLQGVAVLRRNRGLPVNAAVHKIASGPGNLCAALAITRARDNGRDLTYTASGLFLLEDGGAAGEITCTPRVGIRKAADWPLRFFIAGDACVSHGGR
ncbi:MAG: DNA-3-methyladenine glycosylase [Acidobacteriaceae bacterium]